MVHVIAGMAALLAASMQLTSMTEAATTPSAMTLQLHRMPDHGFHPETYARRRLEGAGDDLEVLPLHLGLGTHYTWVYAGTPPQRASVITDTGSGIMAFPCSGCDGCGEHTDQPFVASNSSTLVHVTCSSDSFFQCKECQKDSDVCGISQSYMEGSSWKASVVEDIVYLGGDASFNDEALRNHFGTHFQFGCQRSETGLFITQVADGIMGLSNSDDHIVAKLHRENKIPNKLFSLCFAEQGGAMTLGTVDTTRHQGDVAYAKVISDRSNGHFYNVQMKDIRIGGKSIEADASAYTRGHYIVDSGTTDSYLPRLLKREFMEVFEAVAGKAYQVSGMKCSAYSEEDVANLPTIQFVMEGADGGEMTLDISPEQYLLHQEDGYCGGIFLSEHSGGVIGANIMMNRDVIFDGGNQRVGFVDADCTYEAPKEETAGPVSTTAPVDENSAGSSTAGEEVNRVPTKTVASTPVPVSPSASTAAPTPEPSTVAPTPEPSTVAPTPEPSTTAPVTSVPTATESTASLGGDAEVNTTTTVEAATTQSSSSGSLGAVGEEEHPLVLQVVGAVLVVAFLLVVIMAVRRRKRNGKKQAWSRVNRSEEDGDADDDEEEFGLVTAADRRTPQGRPQQVATSSPRASGAPELSSDEEDEIFNRDAPMQNETKLDARMLERL